VLQRDVVDHLVERALEERRVDRRDRPRPSQAMPAAKQTPWASAIPTS
jgi:hypothetical protein